jgi:hypothetical protein
MRWTKEKEDEVFQCLDGLEWVRWESRKWWADGIWLKDLKDPDDLRYLVSSKVGFLIGKQTFRSLVDIYLSGFVKGHYPNIREEEEVVVLRSTPSYLSSSSYWRRGPREGLWYPVCNKADFRCFLYFMPTHGDLEVITQEHWPQGVYCIREWGLGSEESLDPTGTIDDLFEYWSILAQDVEEGWELSLALMLPALFRQGKVMFMIVGGDSYAQDHLMYRIFRIVDWSPTLVYTKSAYRQVYGLWKQDFVYINRLNHFMASDSESVRLVKLTLDGNRIIVRRPRTDLIVDEFGLYAPVFICSASVKVDEKLATRSLHIHLRDTPLPPYFKDKYRLQPKALMGTFRLFQKAAQIKLSGDFGNYVTNGGDPNVVGIYIPYMGWMHWAYRYACVLGVENKLLDYLERADKWKPSYKKG